MGENEQGGMLRTVVVVGLVALIAAVITMGVIGMKASMNKNTTTGVGTIETTRKAYNKDVVGETVAFNSSGAPAVKNDVVGQILTYMPQIGSIPNNSWRDVAIQIRSDKRIWFIIDVNDNTKVPKRVANGSITNDNDVSTARKMTLYKTGSSDAVKTLGGNLLSKTYIEPNVDYTIVVKYLNKSGEDFVEPDPEIAKTQSGGPSANYSLIGTGIDDDSEYHVTVKSIEAATYDDKYNKD